MELRRNGLPHPIYAGIHANILENKNLTRTKGRLILQAQNTVLGRQQRENITAVYTKCRCALTHTHSSLHASLVLKYVQSFHFCTMRLFFNETSHAYAKIF